jgi:hypothetical protein
MVSVSLSLSPSQHHLDIGHPLNRLACCTFDQNEDYENLSPKERMKLNPDNDYKEPEYTKKCR